MTIERLLSVIICTRDPQRDYFVRVLESLRRQTLNQEVWELVIIDNASTKSLSDDAEIDLDWHGCSSVVREERLGLVNARCRGIREARGQVLVFVDDDNVLDETYLEQTQRIAHQWPQLGAWGGQLSLELACPAASGLEQHLDWLGRRQFTLDLWSNVAESWETAPYGAGMCVRREVAERWAHLVGVDSLRQRLGASGNRGTGVLRNDDIDLGFTSADMGLGTGLFADLKLIHLIPAERVSFPYLLSLAQGHACSKRLLHYARMHEQPSVMRDVLRTVKAVLWRGNGAGDHQRSFEVAQLRGEWQARWILAKFNSAD